VQVVEAVERLAYVDGGEPLRQRAELLEDVDEGAVLDVLQDDVQVVLRIRARRHERAVP